jgi:hypothetical protein
MVVVSCIGVLRRKHEHLSIRIQVNKDGSNARTGGFKQGGGMVGEGGSDG